MKKLIFRYVGLAYFLLSLAWCTHAQNDQLMNNGLYKNVQKYYEQAEQFLQQGNTNDAQKRLKYADQFAQKLVKSGYGNEMQDYLEKITKLQSKIDAQNGTSLAASNTSASTAPAFTGQVMTRAEWRAGVDEVMQLEGQIRNLFNFLPAYAKLNDNYLRPVAALQSGSAQRKIAALKAQPEAQQAYHQSYVKNLERLAATLDDLGTALAESGFSENMANTFAYTADGAKGQSEFVIANTEDYLTQLSAILPDDALLSKMKTQLQSAAAELTAKQVADAKADQQAGAADRSLPVRGLKDASLEQEFKRLARPSVPGSFQIVDVIITSSRWGINKDAVGRPLHRDMIAYMVEKDNNGKCYVQYFVFTQPAVGSGYGKTQVDLDWSSKSRREVDCR